MSEHEDWKTALNRIMDEHDAADRAARRKAEAAHRRTIPEAAADSADLGHNPHETLDED